MKLYFIGADHEVTGSCHCMELAGRKLLVDCGMEQGVDTYENQDIPFPANEIDFVLLTHAHIDHTGMLPVLYKKGFRGQVLATKGTADLCQIMLRDSAHIQMTEAEWRNRKARRSGKPLVEPLYEMEDAEGALRLLKPCPYGEEIVLCQGITAEFTDVGHLLGSSSITLTVAEGGETRKIVFSGDIGNINKPIVKDPIQAEEADYIVMESTYGSRLHEEAPDYVGTMARILNETFQKGGNVVIPAFAVGRTQEMLYFLRLIKKDHLVSAVPDFDVYVDSPLAVEATSIFNKNVMECFDEETMELIRQGINPLVFPGLKTSVTSEDSKAINEDMSPKVIISASGMCEAGRIRHHLKHNLWRPECTVLFVGYQSEGSLGRQLLDGASAVKLFGETIEVRARICTIEGISGHADKKGLLHWVSGLKTPPRQIFVVHGDEDACEEFAKALREEKGYAALAPYSGAVYDLITGTWLVEGKPVPVQKKPAARKADSVYTRLVAAGQRLIALIRRREGSPNKDNVRLAEQIEALCDRWED